MKFDDLIKELNVEYSNIDMMYIMFPMKVSIDGHCSDMYALYSDYSDFYNKVLKLNIPFNIDFNLIKERKLLHEINNYNEYYLLYNSDGTTKLLLNRNYGAPYYDDEYNSSLIKMYKLMNLV